MQQTSQWWQRRASDTTSSVTPMKPILLLLIGLLCLSGSLQAQLPTNAGAGKTTIIKDPIADFLFTRDMNKDSYLSSLKQLYVLKLDIENTGKPVMLLSLNGFDGKQGEFWTAYVPSIGGYRRADDSESTLFFKRTLFFVGYLESVKKYGLLAFIGGEGGGDLNLFQIINGKVIKESVGTLDLSKPQNLKEFTNYFGQSPNWKSLTNNPVTTLNIKDLEKDGYDVTAAMKAAAIAIQPKQSTTN